MQNHRFLQNLTYLLLRIFIFPVIRLIWVGRVSGLENIPRKDGAIVASNHESYFDFICFSAVSPRVVRYLTAAVFFRKWWWYPLVTLTGQIKVERYGPNKKKSAKQALAQAVSLLRQGKIIGIFPEGTRSRSGELQKAFTGVARMALTAKVPVIPVGMIGTYKIMSPHENFPHFRKCRIKIGKPMEFKKYYGQENNPEILEKITTQIMLSIAKLAEKEYEFYQFYYLDKHLKSLAKDGRSKDFMVKRHLSN